MVTDQSLLSRHIARYFRYLRELYDGPQAGTKEWSDQFQTSWLVSSSMPAIPGDNVTLCRLPGMCLQSGHLHKQLQELGE